MTNYEHYKKQIEKFTRMGQKVAVEKDTNEIIPCTDIVCSGCLFGPCDGCTKKSMAWADAEYIEPEVDWSKVPIDTPVLVSDDKKIWVRRHFATPALKNDDPFTVRTFVDGKTEWSSTAMREEELESCERWRYAKLAKGEGNGI